MNKSKRPVNLDLMTIKQPITAVVSILHRLSGVMLFLLMPYMLYALQHSLMSPESFNRTMHCLHHGFLKFSVWVFFSALIYHGLAGVRHLLMDFGVGETAVSGRKTAWVVLGLTAILVVSLGWSLW